MLRSKISSILIAALCAAAASPASARGLVTVLGFPALDSSTKTLVKQMTVRPSNQDIFRYNGLIVCEKNAGVWTLADGQWAPGLAATQQAAQLNLVSPTTLTLLLVSTPTFTAYRGFNGDGAASYVDTTLAPSAATKYTQNDAGLMVWDLIQTANANALIGNGTAIADFITGRSTTSNNINIAVNGGSVVGIAVTGSARGLSAAFRTGAAAMRMDKNGVQQGTSTNASAARSAVTINLGRVNSGFNNHPWSFAWMGGSMTAAQSTAAYNCISASLSAAGAS